MSEKPAPEDIAEIATAKEETSLGNRIRLAEILRGVDEKVKAAGISDEEITREASRLKIWI